MDLFKQTKSFYCLFIIPITFCLSACGTMAGQHQIISIDSEPTGAQVHHHEEENSKLRTKTTPFFYSVPRASHLETTLSLNHEKKSATIDCGLRWSESVFPNSILTGIFMLGTRSIPAGLFLGSIAYLIDVSTGAMWDCDEQIKIKLPSNSLSNASEPAAAPRDFNACRNFVIISPFEDDETLSEKYAVYWMDEVKSHLRSCDQFIYGEKLKKYLSYFNNDGRQKIIFSSFNRQQLMKLGYDLQASHMVFLNAERANQTIHLVPQIYSLHTLQKVDLRWSRVAVSEKTLKPKRSIWIEKSFSLLPNALSYGSPQHNSGIINTPNGTTLIDSKEINTMPQYISALGVTTTKHPQSYRPWQFVLQGSPSLSSNYMSMKLRYQNSKGEELQHKLQYFYLIPEFNTGVSLHLPIGTLNLLGGIGPAWLWYIDSASNYMNVISWALSAKIYFDLFITQNFFFRLETVAYSINGKHVSNEYFKSKDIKYSGLVLGWYLPTMRTQARSLFK